jgi:hypothetical protein
MNIILLHVGSIRPLKIKLYSDENAIINLVRIKPGLSDHSPDNLFKEP